MNPKWDFGGDSCSCLREITYQIYTEIVHSAPPPPNNGIAFLSSPDVINELSSILLP